MQHSDSVKTHWKMTQSVWAFVLILSAFSIVNAELDVSLDQKSDDQGLKMNWIEKKIKEKIESFREVLRKGEPALGIPILDPYRRDDAVINVNTTLVSASTDIENFTVVGLSSYSVDNVHFSLSSMSASIRLSWTGIKMKAEYNLDGVLNIPLAGASPLYGNGTARALFYQIWIESKIKFGIEEDENVKASDLDLSWETVNPQVRIDGLFGGQQLSDTINRVIKDLIPKLDAAYHDKAKNILEQKVLKLINDYLSHMKGEEDS